MSILITFLVAIISILLSKKLFTKWFNHLSMYSIIWMMLIFMYEIKLIAYYNLSSQTWLIIIVAFLSLWLGTLTITTGRQVFRKNIEDEFDKQNSITKKLLFNDGGKTLEISIIIFTLLGLVSALTHWMLLIKKFGSIIAALLNSAIIYQLRVTGEISTGIPYIFAGTHIAIILSGIYLAYSGKLKLFLIFPFFVLIIKSLAEVSRAGLLLGFFEFVISFVVMKQFLLTKGLTTTSVSKKKIVFTFLIILVFVIGSATLVKTFRAPFERFSASSRELNQWEKGIVFSPSIYLYMSSHLGVLNSYLADQDEHNYFGEVTFFPFYRLISKFNVIKKPRYYQKGYFIPLWTNTGTYLRDLHADFGYAGIFIVPYLLGILITFYWFKMYEHYDVRYMIAVIYLDIVIAFSFLLMATRFGNWLIGLLILLIIMPLLEKRVSNKSSPKDSKIL